MNIVVCSIENIVLSRADTTWDRENKDLYVPDFINSFMYTPVLFARISKPGRCISEKFVSRYYDAIGFGLLLYPTELLESGPMGWACASCMDHTSFLPHPLYNPICLGQPENIFELKKDGQSIYSTPAPDKSLIEKAICTCSQICSLRCGDMVAVELKEISSLASRHEEELCDLKAESNNLASRYEAESCEIANRSESEIRIEGSFCGNLTTDFKIIF